MLCRILNAGQATGYIRRAITKWYMLDAVQLANGTEWVLPERVMDDMQKFMNSPNTTEEEKSQAEGVYSSLSSRTVRDVSLSEFPQDPSIF